MKNLNVIAIAALALSLTACSGSSTTSGSIDLGNEGATALSIPKITDPVAGNGGTDFTTLSMKAQMQQSVSAQSTCDSSSCPVFDKAWQTTRTAIYRGSTNDFWSCIAEGVVKTYIPEADQKKDRTFYVRNSSNDNRIKFTLQFDGQRLKQFNAHYCGGPTQFDQTWSSKLVTTSGGNVAAVFKVMQGTTGYKTQVNTTGTVVNGQWTQKRVTAEGVQSTPVYYFERSILDQGSNVIRLQYIYEDQNDSTNDLHLWSQMGFSGINALWKQQSAYSVGSASIKVGTGVLQSPVSFDPSTGTEVSGDTSKPYALLASQASFLSTPNPAIVFNTDEQWDCQIPYTETPYELDTFQTDATDLVNACQASY